MASCSLDRMPAARSRRPGCIPWPPLRARRLHRAPWQRTRRCWSWRSRSRRAPYPAGRERLPRPGRAPARLPWRRTIARCPVAGLARPPRFGAGCRSPGRTSMLPASRVRNARRSPDLVPGQGASDLPVYLQALSLIHTAAASSTASSCWTSQFEQLVGHPRGRGRACVRDRCTPIEASACGAGKFPRDRPNRELLQQAASVLFRAGKR